MTIVQTFKIKQDKKKKNCKIFLLLLSFCIIIIQFPTPPLSFQSGRVSALGGEAEFSPCFHSDRDEEEQTKKLEIEKKNKVKKSYSFVYNKSSSFLYNSLFKEDNAVSVTVCSDNEPLMYSYMKKRLLISNTHLGTTILNE